MKILPDGRVEITNGDTGEKRVVSPAELTNYGIDPADYTAAKNIAVPAGGGTLAAPKTPLLTSTPPVSSNSSFTPTSPITPTTPTTPKSKTLSYDQYVAALIQKGAKVDEATAFAKKKYGITDQAPEQRTIGGFIGNVAKSGVSNAVGIAKGIGNIFNNDLNQNTLVSIARLPFEAGKAAAGDKSKDNRFNALVDFYKNRYGSLQKAETAFYEDPVGVALDASVVIGGAGSVVKGLGSVSKAESLTRAGTVLSEAGAAIDPLAQSGKLVGKTLGPIGGLKTKVAEDAAARSIKATPSELTKFEDIAGTEMGAYQKSKGLYSMKDVELQKKVIQGLYNDAVKTNKEIPASLFAKQLRARAAEIASKDVSRAARGVVAGLLDEAKVYDKMGTVTDTVLTQSKSSAFGKAPGSVITDPVALNIDKEIGKVGLATLEKIAPGSGRLGKELQILTELGDVIKKAKNKGLTTNRLNILKPGGAGAAIGMGLGAFTGNPLVGGALGAVAGTVLDSQTGQRFIAKALGATPPSAVTANAGRLGSVAYQAGKLGSRVNPTGPSSREVPVLQGTPTGTSPTTQETLSYGNDNAIKTENQSNKNPLAGYTVDGQPLSARDAAIIDGIVNYKLDLSKITSLRSDERTRIAGLAAQYDPTWDMSQYPARQALRKDFTSGKSSQNIRSLNTAVGHLSSLAKAGEALGNTPYSIINTGKNTLGQAVGQAQKTKFDNAVNAVAGEMSTVFKGSSGTDQEIKSWKDQMNSSQSPEQIKEGINQMIELMGSRLSAFDSQWTSGMGKPRDFKLLSPKSREILQGLGIDVNALDPIASQ